MRYSEITEDASQTFYHVTWQSRLSSIREHGLMPGKKRNWKSSGDHKPIGSRDHIHLFGDLSDAVRWAHKMWYDFDRPVAILACHPTGAFEKDPNIQVMLTYNLAVLTDNPIPPDAITGMIHPDHTLYRQIVNGGTIKQQPAWTTFSRPRPANWRGSWKTT